MGRSTFAFVATMTALGVAVAACSFGLDTESFSGGTADDAGGSSGASSSSSSSSSGNALVGTSDASSSTDATADAADVVGDDAAPTDVTACGGNGLEGDWSTLYKRVAGAVTVVEVCAKGCEWTKTNTDTCRTNASCDFGQGDYCGENGLSGRPDVLFTCGNGKIVPKQVCTNGCKKKSANVDDECN